VYSIDKFWENVCEEIMYPPGKKITNTQRKQVREAAKLATGRCKYAHLLQGCTPPPSIFGIYPPGVQSGNNPPYMSICIMPTFSKKIFLPKFGRQIGKHPRTNIFQKQFF